MEGFEVPITRSLTEKILIMGLPREVFFMNGTIAAILLLGTHQWYLLPISLVIHIIASHYTKKDTFFFDCFKRYIKRASYFDA
ncbi:MAG: VirB3 family type IV secretion system protein [Patescibacteria group bacterium]|jgi:type IV secretory pathway TrbD component